jgi:hypothetical protein
MVWSGIWSMSRRALNHAEHAGPSAAAATGRLDGGHVVDDELAAILRASLPMRSSRRSCSGRAVAVVRSACRFRLDFRVRVPGDVVRQGFSVGLVAVADRHGFRVEWENTNSCGSATQNQSDRTRRDDSFSTNLFSVTVRLSLRNSRLLRRPGRHRPRPAGQVRHRVRPER